MRKIVVREMITVDGFFAGPAGEIEWHLVDTEFNEDSLKFLNSIDTLMFGRVTYDLMASHWPTEDVIKNDSVIAEKMNSLPKLVYSKTADKLEWNNSKILSSIDVEEIKKMKEAEGRDIGIFGSGTIVSALTALGLVDEYRFVVNPVILGKGKTLFPDVSKRSLTLIGTKEFASGNVLLHYKI